mmetsp:Transcript_1770/g.6475  ORF Transcript_1770/g.6475 Transcript_1770/m.6475 type:complete len:253 (+) Transcript_1770:1161-1919(+)
MVKFMRSRRKLSTIMSTALRNSLVSSTTKSAQARSSAGSASSSLSSHCASSFSYDALMCAANNTRSVDFFFNAYAAAASPSVEFTSCTNASIIWTRTCSKCAAATSESALATRTCKSILFASRTALSKYLASSSYGLTAMSVKATIFLPSWEIFPAVAPACNSASSGASTTFASAASAISSHRTVATIILCAGKSKSLFAFTAFQTSRIDTLKPEIGTPVLGDFKLSASLAGASNRSRSAFASVSNFSRSCS